MKVFGKSADSDGGALAALGGKRPTRRRPAYEWEQARAYLEARIEEEAPARAVFLQKTGHCPRCLCYFGQGVHFHIDACKK